MKFQLITAHYAQLLLKQLQGESDRTKVFDKNSMIMTGPGDKRRPQLFSDLDIAMRDIQTTGADAIGGSWLFVPEGTAEPNSWIVFREVGVRQDKRIIFVFDRQLRSEGRKADFVNDCSYCFRGRALNQAAVLGVVTRLQHGLTSEIDLIRTLMNLDEARVRGRFLVFADPSPWLEAIIPKNGKTGVWPRLRLEA